MPSLIEDLLQLRTHISSLHQLVYLRLYIPPTFVGAVIGRGGKTILNLQKEAARQSQHSQPVRITVHSRHHESGGGSHLHAAEQQSLLLETTTTIDERNHDHTTTTTTTTTTADDTNTAATDAVAIDEEEEEEEEQQQEWAEVLIKGDPVGVFAAAKLIQPLVENEMDDCVLDVPLNRYKHHSAIIGKRGLTIMGLSADHNTRIFVPSKFHHHHHGSDEADNVGRKELSNVQFEGELENVERCLVAALKVLAAAVNDSSSSNNNNNNKPIKKKPAAGNKDLLLSSEEEQVMDTTAAEQGEGSSSGGHNNNNNKPALSVPKKALTKKIHPSDPYIVNTPLDCPYNTPSLTQLRLLGKRTSTIVRRKRVSKDDEDDGIDDNGDDNDDDDDDDSHTEEQAAAVCDAMPTKDVTDEGTQFLVSGREDNVLLVEEILSKYFAGEKLEGLVDALPLKKPNKRGGKYSKNNKPKNHHNHSKMPTASNSQEKPPPLIVD